MLKTLLVPLVVLTSASAIAAADTPVTPAPAGYTKLKAGTTTLKKKNGYWTECSYTAVGESCYTVYAGSSPKPGAATTGALRPVAAGAGKLTRNNGYVMQCDYSGLGDNCYYVYARARTLKKAK